MSRSRPTTQPPKAAPTPDRRADESVKDTVESIIIAFVLAFVFRAFVVEAFVIPTGSMAPTLLGEHLGVQCRQCGYRFNTDTRTRARGRSGGAAQGRRGQPPDSPMAACPMCAFENTIARSTRRLAGDRILVQKYIYSISKPRRWDVVVFKAPHTPKMNFIKRLIGLPNEDLILFDGNVFVRPTSPDGSPDGPWMIARKTDPRSTRRWQAVQQAVWQPIYHSHYSPRDRGAKRWQVPWVVTEPAGPAGASTWKIDGRRSYRYDGGEPGRIRFDFNRCGAARAEARYPYNQFQTDVGGSSSSEPIEDVRLAVTFRPDGPGLEAALSTTARLDTRDSLPEVLSARVDTDGRLWLEATNSSTGETRPLTDGQIAPLPARATTEIELWYVDHEASVWVNGKRKLVHSFDLDLEKLRRLPRPSSTPEVEIAVAGGPVTLGRIEFDRDLYYSGRNGARGALLRRGQSIDDSCVRLTREQFFCVGDNSPRSHDSRYWGLNRDPVNPWIRTRLFGPGTDPDGIVPGSLMMGRAFLVYFPGPFPMFRHSYGVLPNFGDMRLIR